MSGPCPECGAPLGAAAGRRTRRGLIAGAFVVAAAGAVVAFWPRSDGTANRASTPNDERGPGAATGTVDDTPKIEAEVDQPAARANASSHWSWTTTNEPSVPPVAIRTPSGFRLVAVLSTLPTNETPRFGGRVARLGVAYRDSFADLALLVPESTREVHYDLEPRAAASAAAIPLGSQLTSLGPAADEGEVVVTGRTPEGRLELDRSQHPGAALLDAEGRIVAIVRSLREAVPLDPVLSFLDTPASESFEALQASLRRENPRLVIDDARKLLDGQPGADELRAMLETLAAATYRAGSRNALEELASAECDVWRRLARRLVADRDQTGATAAVRQAVARHPSHAGLLEDAALLCANGGESVEAGAWYARLRALDPTRADAVAGDFADALATAARQLARAGRSTGALAAIDQAIVVLPARADLLAQRADLLQRLGRRVEALEAAQRAAALDATYTPLANELAEAVARQNDPDVVEIPFDPDSHVIRAAVRAGDVPLDLVVDTGATTTIVPVAVAERLGLRDPSNRRVQVQTAGGAVEGELVRIPSLAIGAIQLRAVEAVALDLPGALAGSGLLGMNALSRFRVEIDAARGLLVLRRRPDPR